MTFPVDPWPDILSILAYGVVVGSRAVERPNLSATRHHGYSSVRTPDWPGFPSLEEQVR